MSKAFFIDGGKKCQSDSCLLKIYTKSEGNGIWSNALTTIEFQVCNIELRRDNWFIKNNVFSTNPPMTSANYTLFSHPQPPDKYTQWNNKP